MNFKQLQYFVSTAKHGSITAAARELDVAQPSISQQLANLEFELKNTLFERNYKGVHLTESGRVFYSHATELLNRMIFAKNAITDMAKYPSGTVSLGLTQSIDNILAIPLVNEISKIFPDIKVQITTLPSKCLNKALADKEIDIALSYKEEVPTANIIRKPLIREDLFVIVGTRDAVTYKDLLSVDALSFDAICHLAMLAPGHKDTLLDTLKNMEVKKEKKLKLLAGFGQLSTALRVVVQGRGIMIAPSSASYHLAEKGLVKLIPLIDDELKREVTINTHVDSSISKAMSIVMNTIISLTRVANKNRSWAGEFVYSDTEDRHYIDRSNISELITCK
ncbi:LysR family transcriptional regulator [Alteromonas sp. 14N.309.X.WAT.G.H12]|uniref:LysR family transcriptional regulator n=1 Tax=Alteromonas sp. 14N.309.X.WAT.G.H12 TaxID=3120824 RepID=UPI002FD63424